MKGNIYVLNTGTKGAGFYKLADNGSPRQQGIPRI